MGNWSMAWMVGVIGMSVEIGTQSGNTLSNTVVRILAELPRSITRVGDMMCVDTKVLRAL